MHTESSDPRAASAQRLERAVILVLLSEDDGQRRWSRMELRQGMGVGEDDFARAIDGLLDAGVLQQEHDYVWPSPSTRRLDALELIGV